LIELLIVIAIIAVLAVVVVLTLNPAELLRQARDSTRLSDVAAINGALSFYLADQVDGFGSLSGCYVHEGNDGSIAINMADTNGTDDCQELGFTTALTDTVAVGATARDVDGNGWIPLDFTDISSGQPFGILPVDPVNSVDPNPELTVDGNYYALALDGANSQYKLITNMESTKFSSGPSNVEDTDGGDVSTLYEAGNDLSL